CLISLAELVYIQKYNSEIRAADHLPQWNVAASIVVWLLTRTGIPEPKMDENKHAADVAEEVGKQHRIQEQIDRQDREGDSGEEKPKAMQAGAREYPVPPFPEQHQPKPGDEAALEPAPMYDAPFWQGSGKLEGKVALITGGDSGIGRAVAVLFAREGADVAIAYLSESEDAEDTRLAVADEGRRCLLLPGDVTSEAFCNDAVEKVVAEFGKLDILVNNAAFQ